MSSPPVDPWSGQPEHEPHYDFPPPRPDNYPAPPPAAGWAAPPASPPPYDGGWPATPHPGPPPAQPYPTQPYSTPPYSTPPPNSTPPYSPPHSTPPHGAYPGTPQAGFPAGQYAGYPPHPAAGGGQARSRQLILALGLVGLLVLCLGGGGLAYVALNDDGSPDPRPTPTAGPTQASSATPSAATSSPATPSPDASEAPRIRVVAPDTLAGRAKSTEPTLKKAADDMVRELRTSVTGETGVAGAFYGSADERNMVMVIAASAFVLNPERELDDTVKGMSKGLSVKRMTTIAPGPQGGLAKCGDGESAGVPLGVCAWADHGSVGVIVMFFSSAAASAAEFVAIRGEIEQKY
ncbi:hypothetical protein [Micromonospora sp. NPDC047074]|uniref:hypothetical protein n=1 Tax=Micromonospora sp. NPDC047074 TaxID=3154339 RepID=UPI0033C14E4A